MHQVGVAAPTTDRLPARADRRSPRRPGQARARRYGVRSEALSDRRDARASSTTARRPRSAPRRVPPIGRAARAEIVTPLPSWREVVDPSAERQRDTRMRAHRFQQHGLQVAAMDDPIGRVVASRPRSRRKAPAPAPAPSSRPGPEAPPERPRGAATAGRGRGRAERARHWAKAAGPRRPLPDVAPGRTRRRRIRAARAPAPPSGRRCPRRR